MECPPEEADNESEIILQVRGVSPSTNAFTVQMYFENSRRSGGGEIKKLKIKDGIFDIEFKDEQVIDMVLKKKHIIDKTTIEVCRCPPKPVPTCSNKVFLTNISEKTTRDGLENFLEAKANVTPVSIEYGELKGTALITFEKDIDFEKLQLACKKRTLDDSHLEVSAVPVTNCVIVWNISESMSHDTLLFYFDNEKRSGVSGVMDVKMLDGFCLVYFEEPEAVNIVCGRPHRIIDHDLDIKMYHKCLGHIEAKENLLKHPPLLEVHDKKGQERKKQPVQEEKQLKRHLLQMLQLCKFEQELQKKYKDVSLKYDISKNLVKFKGLSGEVTNAIVEMYEFVSKVTKTEVKKFSKLLQQFLQQHPVYMYVNSKMKEKNIIGIWEFCKGEETLTVFSVSYELAVQTAHLIIESVLEIKIVLSNESRVLLSTREWLSKVDEIEKNGQGLIKIIAQADKERVIILCTDQWDGLVREYIERFMLPNTIYEESLNLEPAIMRYLQMNCTVDLNNVLRSLESEKVNVVVYDTGIVIKATRTGLNQAKFAIGKIVKGVKKQTYSINKAGIRKHMKSTAGQEKLRKVERSEGIVIEVSDESASDEDTSSSWLTTGAKRQELAVCVTKEGKKISATVVDILELDVDVIVNPANKNMKHIGGIAKFITEKGGRAIQDDCNDYVRKKGRLMEGQVYLSAAGNLKCKGVIHAVGPVWQNGINKEEGYLREAVFKSLEVTSARRFTSIAFPALCTGVFGYPVREATRVIVVAVRDFFRENSGSSVVAVYLCGLEKETVNCFATAMMREMKNVILKSEENENQWKCAQVPVHARTSNPGADIWGKARKAPRPVEDMRSVTLGVYGKDVNQIKKAIRIIEDDVDGIFKSKVYSESIIKQFSTSQKNEIQNLQKAHDVDVSVETRIGRITVRGLIEDVMNASEKVHQMIRKAEAIQQDKQAAEMMAAMVEWCFLDAGSIPSKLEKYPPNINLQLEKALRKQEPKTSFCDSKGVKYIVDFTTYEEYPESDPSDSVKVIRKSKIDGSSFEIPPTWTSMDSKENVSVVTLLQNSQEYQDVQNDFVQTTGHTIVKIERIQNKMLLQQYEAKLKLLEGQNPAGTTNERKLWHGTANESVASINTYGFNRSYCGKNAVVHGNGVYFAVNASYSARDQYSPRDFNTNKRIYQCRVLTGEFCQGAQGMKVPPNKPNTGAGTTHILYDSVVDNVRNPGIFVIFNDTQAYPEYLITFQ